MAKPPPTAPNAKAPPAKTDATAKAPTGSKPAPATNSKDPKAAAKTEALKLTPEEQKQLDDMRKKVEESLL